MNNIDDTGIDSNPAAPNGASAGQTSAFRYATRLTAMLAVVSAVMLPLLPTITEASASPGQHVAQAAADRVAASGGMLWLDADDSVFCATAE